MQVTAALLECDGDAPEAKALLEGGWALPAPVSVAGACVFAPPSRGSVPANHPPVAAARPARVQRKRAESWGVRAAPAGQGAGGGCPFGGAVGTAELSKRNPNMLVETLRERFSERVHATEGHLAGRVLSSAAQRALDELMAPASLQTPSAM